MLAQVVEELSSLLVGARVERVYQGSDGGFYIVFIRERRKLILLLSPVRALPRLHLVSTKPTAEASPHGFILYLRSHLSGARVMTAALLNQDRIVELGFSRAGREYSLVFELFGSAANLILADPSMKILAVYHHVPPEDQKVRSLLPGLPYVLPGKKPVLLPGEYSPASAEGGTVSANKAAEQYYEDLIEQRRILSLRTELLAVLKKSLSRIERLISALSSELHSVELAEDYRRTGDLILANLKTLKTGTERVDLAGYDGATVTVRLDPKRSPAKNAEAYFKKYKKAKTGRGIIETRLRQAEDEAYYLKTLLSGLDQAGNYSWLNELHAELAARGYVRVRGRAHTGSPSLPFRKIVFSGWDILIGKNAAGNDYISTKMARPDDLWLHAEGLPGSHVLVRNPGKRDIPPAVLLKAAALAAFYSKGRASGTVSVTYTRAGLVKKPKGAKPGLVTLSERRSLMVKPEDG